MKLYAIPETLERDVEYVCRGVPFHSAPYLAPPPLNGAGGTSYVITGWDVVYYLEI